MTLRRGRKLLQRMLRPSAPVLLVVQDASSEKAAELRRRLDFYLNAACRASKVPDIVVRTKLLYAEVLAARAVAVGDSTMLAGLSGGLFDHVFDVDYESNRDDGWAWSLLALSVDPQRAASRDVVAKQRFDALLARLRTRGRKTTFVFGTGPSLARARDAKFAEGNVIVCNTIVRDRELFEHLDPDILVAGDAIYHFGFTEHARAFRRDLRDRLAERAGRTWFVYPSIFLPVIEQELGDLARYTIAVPVGTHTDPCVDLGRRFELPSLGNVLNLLLLPVGCSLSREVKLWGFDGRAPDDRLFWANSARHSYPELMDGLRSAHPAFFRKSVPTGNETAYVASVHGDELDARLREAEDRGMDFEMLHPSWTPTLHRRYRGSESPGGPWREPKLP